MFPFQASRARERNNAYLMAPATASTVLVLSTRGRLIQRPAHRGAAMSETNTLPLVTIRGPHDPPPGGRRQVASRVGVATVAQF